MNEQKPRQPMCYACRSTDVEEIVRARAFTPRKQVVEVPLLTTRCKNCGAEFTTGRQHDENLKRLAERRTHPAYRGLLLGEDIVQFRLRYGLTQRQAAKIFRAGKVAFSRYENEASYPDDRMACLLELAIAKPAALKHLADTAGVEVPLWDARCEDERKIKLAVIPDRQQSKTVDAWTNRQRAGGPAWPPALVDSGYAIEFNSANDEAYAEAITA